MRANHRLPYFTGKDLSMPKSPDTPKNARLRRPAHFWGTKKFPVSGSVIIFFQLCKGLLAYRRTPSTVGRLLPIMLAAENSSNERRKPIPRFQLGAPNRFARRPGTQRFHDAEPGKSRDRLRNSPPARKSRFGLLSSEPALTASGLRPSFRPSSRRRSGTRGSQSNAIACKLGTASPASGPVCRTTVPGKLHAITRNVPPSPHHLSGHYHSARVKTPPLRRQG